MLVADPALRALRGGGAASRSGRMFGIADLELLGAEPPNVVTSFHAAVLSLASWM